MQDIGFMRVEVVVANKARRILKPKTQTAKADYKKFIRKDEIKCLALKEDWENAGLDYSEAWGKAHQNLKDCSQCVT
ncbi:hypothetical protein [Shimia sp.]|uniref:hypothetical protein n=1 Tax=Shimia sp. TaxID=1954381 RepID=UPI0025FAF562|nr:hypothetical protein [Shimia sp.]